MSPIPTKSVLRAEARRRSAPTAAESQAVCEQVIAWLRTQDPTPVLVWMAMPGELDLAPAVEDMPDLEWLTTRTPMTGPLTVHSYHSPCEIHRYGFPQPVAEAPQVPVARIGVALIPGVMFDHHGGRLGRGKGYYDRLLAGLASGVPRVGVTLQGWLAPALPQEPHDIVMTHLITDGGVSETG